MFLLNPSAHDRPYQDPRSKEVMLKTIAFFEQKGKNKLCQDYHAHTFYDDFVEFVKQEEIFKTLMTRKDYGSGQDRWETWRICEFTEILGFYGLPYWYVFQVSALGLGPVWMSKNEKIKQRAAKLLQQGAIFAFGLSEKDHGADIYSTDMILTPNGDGSYKANGRKYYIGNGNKARIVSTFGKMADTGEYVFFAADSQHSQYECVKNVVASQNFVSEYQLSDYPITEDDIIGRGDEAWDMALNTINICKYNLGWASVGMCTHSLYEALQHASNRTLYNMKVTDFAHVKQLFVDAFSRITAMKLVALRAADYMRVASDDDKRYLLFNPLVKMKVTTQGEDAMNHMWDVVAAKGFEKDTFFGVAAMDIRALPKLEGTVHVNIALIVKFMQNYLFNPAEFPEVGRQDQPLEDTFLFNQGPTKGLGKIQFADHNIAYDRYSLANVTVFKTQINAFKAMLVKATPSPEQSKDVDFLLAVGEIFTLIVYGQLVLENAKLYAIEDDVVDQIFDFMVRDFSRYAVDLSNKRLATDAQSAMCLQMIRRPVVDNERYQRVWQQQVLVHKDSYEMQR